MRYALIAVLALIFLLAGRPDFLAAPDACFWTKAIAHHWFHANIFHLAANCLSAWFVFKVTPYRSERTNIRNFLTATIVATLSYAAALRPVVGISNILFAVLGLRTPSFKHPWWKNPGTIVFFAITLLMLAFPQFSATTHIVSFLCGTAIAAVKRKLNSLKHDYRQSVNR